MTPLTRITPATVDVLQCLLSETPVWGLQVIKLTQRPAGSVYPILERLERFGWVDSKWEDDPARSGPRRRWYSITTDGAISAREVVRSVAQRPVLRANPAGAGA